MINSMTGFGHYETVRDKRRVLCEIKSVNHRYLDLTVKTSRSISFLELTIRNFLKERIGRGKVDAYVHFEEAADETYDLRYNEELAIEYVNSMKRISETFDIVNDLTATKLASYPDVLELVTGDKDEDAIKELVLATVDGALKEFLDSRATEGANLREDLFAKLEEMSGYVSQIEVKAPSIIEDYRSRLIEKIHDLLEDAQIDESRIATEVTIYADKICVDEELVRLKSHIKEMKETLSSDAAVGRKLDFLAQEMNREANTILSKSTDAEVAEIGISLKTLIEKIREQVQNLE